MRPQSSHPKEEVYAPFGVHSNILTDFSYNSANHSLCCSCHDKSQCMKESIATVQEDQFSNFKKKYTKKTSSHISKHPRMATATTRNEDSNTDDSNFPPQHRHLLLLNVLTTLVRSPTLRYPWPNLSHHPYSHCFFCRLLRSCEKPFQKMQAHQEKQESQCSWCKCSHLDRCCNPCTSYSIKQFHSSEGSQNGLWC